jgi:hypothetical protein
LDCISAYIAFLTGDSAQDADATLISIIRGVA